MLTVATAAAILRSQPYDVVYRDFGRRYPNAGYGAAFYRWLFADRPEPYNSYGNGSAMRVSPVGWAWDDEATVLREAERSAVVTHSHPEGVKGAQAVALAVFKARSGETKNEIREAITSRFGYDMGRTIEEIRPAYRFYVTCQDSVPEALIAFLDSSDFEHAVRLAISLGGDSDTQGAIAGAVAHAYYGPLETVIGEVVRQRLPNEFIEILDEFSDRHGMTPPAFG